LISIKDGFLAGLVLAVVVVEPIGRGGAGGSRRDGVREASARAENRASRRVMEKLGMPLQKSEHHEAGEEAHYAVSRWEFLARPSSQAGFRKATVLEVKGIGRE